MSRRDETSLDRSDQPSRSSEVPDLEDLARVFVEGPGGAAGGIERKEPKAPPQSPAAPLNAAPAIELKIAISSETDSETDSEAKVDEEAPTREHRAVEAETEVKTSLYNPSVSNLLERLTKPEVAAVEDPLVAGTRQMINEIENSVADIKLLKHAAKEERSNAVVNAQLIADDAALLLEALPEDVEIVSPLRAELQGLYEMYTQLITELTPKAPVPPRPKKPKEIPLHTGEREAIQDYRRSHRRRNILIGLVLVLIAGRVALWLMEEKHYDVEQLRQGAANVTVNHAAGATEKQLFDGIPSVVEVYLSQEASGALRVRALPLDPNGDPVTLTYRWLAQDRVVEIEQRGILPADQVKPGVAYAVRVTASDGKHESEPVTTAPLVAGGPQHEATTGRRAR